MPALLSLSLSLSPSFSLPFSLSLPPSFSVSLSLWLGEIQHAHTFCLHMHAFCLEISKRSSFSQSVSMHDYYINYTPIEISDIKSFITFAPDDLTNLRGSRRHRQVRIWASQEGRRDGQGQPRHRLHLHPLPLHQVGPQHLRTLTGHSTF